MERHRPVAADMPNESYSTICPATIDGIVGGPS